MAKKLYAEREKLKANLVKIVIIFWLFWDIFE